MPSNNTWLNKYKLKRKSIIFKPLRTTIGRMQRLILTHKIVLQFYLTSHLESIIIRIISNSQEMTGQRQLLT